MKEMPKVFPPLAGILTVFFRCCCIASSAPHTPTGGGGPTLSSTPMVARLPPELRKEKYI